MQIKITGEQPFQVLATNFVIGPSSDSYTLQVSADGVNYSNLFSVAANTTKMVTNVASGGYYRLSGNTAEVTVNWRKQCSDGQSGGGGGSYTLPIAGVGDNGILGGVKVDGTSITIDTNGVISSEGGSDPQLREDIIEGRVVAGLARQLQSPDGVNVSGAPYVMRSTAMAVSISTDFAELNAVKANTVAEEPVYEGAVGTFNEAERFTVTVDEGYVVASAETYTYTDGAWSPSLPSGVTIQGLAFGGNSFTLIPRVRTYEIINHTDRLVVFNESLIVTDFRYQLPLGISTVQVRTNSNINIYDPDGNLISINGRTDLSQTNVNDWLGLSFPNNMPYGQSFEIKVTEDVVIEYNYDRFKVTLPEGYAVEESETYTYANGAWSPSLPEGLTVNGQVFDGDSFTLNPSDIRVYSIGEQHFADPNTYAEVIGTGTVMEGPEAIGTNIIKQTMVDGGVRVDITYADGSETYFDWSGYEEKTGTQVVGTIDRINDWYELIITKTSAIEYHYADRPIPTLSIDNDTFREAVEGISGTYTFEKTDGEWTPAIADYGITFDGDTFDGDSLNVAYTAKNYSTLVDATPTAFYGTGLNSFDKDGVFSTILENKAIDSDGQIVDEDGAYVVFVKAVKGLADGYVVYGDVDAMGLADSTDVEVVEDVTYDLTFAVDKDYIAITTYDINTLCVHPRWSGIKDDEYEAFQIHKIAMPAVDKDGNALPAFVAVGNTRNEYRFENATYIQRVEVIDTIEELIQEYRYSKEWGVDYVFDDNHIYRVLDEPVIFDLEPIDNLYWVDDFGVEGFEGTEIGALTDTWYMANLVDKLRRDVVTKDEIPTPDRIVAVDEFPETAEIGDVISKKDKVLQALGSWDTTATTTSFVFTFPSLGAVENSVMLWEWFSSYPELFANPTNGTFDFYVKYRNASEKTYLGSVAYGETNTINFTRDGVSSNPNTITLNWTEEGTLRVNISNSMSVQQPGNIMALVDACNLYTYCDGGEVIETMKGTQSASFYIKNYEAVDGMPLLEMKYRYGSAYRVFTIDTTNHCINVTESGDPETVLYTIQQNAGEVKIPTKEVSSYYLITKWEDNAIFVYTQDVLDFTPLATLYSNTPVWLMKDTDKHYYMPAGSGIPNWDNNGFITGTAYAASTQSIPINAQYNFQKGITYYGEKAGSLDRLYVPTQSGTAGQVLQSAGEYQEPTWTTLIKSVRITEDEYEALATKDPNTLYLIVEE